MSFSYRCSCEAITSCVFLHGFSISKKFPRNLHVGMAAAPRGAHGRVYFEVQLAQQSLNWGFCGKQLFKLA